METIKIGKARLEQSEVGKVKCYSGDPYGEIITTEVPIRWYWGKGGSFDGLLIGPSKNGFSSIEIIYLEKICEALLPVVAKIQTEA